PVLVGFGRGRLVGDPLEPRLDRPGHDRPSEREVIDEDERLVVPEFGPDRPAEEGPDGSPLLDLPRGPAGLARGFGGEDLRDLLARVADRDRLATVDLLALLAGDRVQRLYPPRVHDRDVAELVVSGPGAGPLDRLGRPGGQPGRQDRGQDQAGWNLGER